MTTPSGSGPDPAALLRRLRARPVSSWGHGDRERAMRAALQRLADLAGDAGGGAAGVRDAGAGGIAGMVADRRRAVPDLGAGALVDQFAVLYRDAVEVGVPDVVLGRILADLASALSLGREPQRRE